MNQFEKLFECYQNDVLKFLLGLTKEPRLAEDLTQDTFLRAYLGFDRFREECSPKTWLLQIAKNEYFKYLRRNKNGPEIPSDDSLLLEIADVKHRAIENQLHQRELIASILNYIFSLDEPSKTVIIDRIWLEKSYKTISAELNLSEAAAKMVFFRNKKAIKNKFREELDDEE